jgi:hypothetical protein
MDKITDIVTKNAQNSERRTNVKRSVYDTMFCYSEILLEIKLRKEL